MCTCVCVSGCHVCAYLWKPEVMNHLELYLQGAAWHGCWKSNPSPLEEQYTFFFLSGTWVRCCSPNTVPERRLQFSLKSTLSFPPGTLLTGSRGVFPAAALHLDQESPNFNYQGSRAELPFLSSQQALGFCAKQFTFGSETKPPCQRHIGVFAFTKPQSFLFTLLLGQGTPT